MRIFVGLFTFFVVIGLGISFPLIKEKGNLEFDRSREGEGQKSFNQQQDSKGQRGLASQYSDSAKNKNVSSESMDERVKKIQSAILCWNSNDCDYPETDPRSYSFAVAKDIAKNIDEFLVQHSDDPNFAEKAETVAESAMKIIDGHVQSKALELYGRLPPNAKNLQSILAGMENSPNPLLVEQAMKEFQRYLGSPEEEKIQAFLAHFIAHGGQFSSEQASEAIFPFLNERSVAQFREALEKMEAASTQAQYLRAAIQEFERTQTGG